MSSSSMQKVTDIIVTSGLNDNSWIAFNDAASIAVVPGDTITQSPSIRFANSYDPANALNGAKIKYASPIKGTSVINYKGAKYAPAQRCVVSIGYNRLTATGSIDPNASTEYLGRIVFKNDKTFYSERPESFNLNFVSAAAATQLSIAIQIAKAVNSSAYGASTPGVKVIAAIVVGNGTGVVAASGATPAIYGGVGATVYGVEITGLTINQFQNTQYDEELVNFSVFLDSVSGFGDTTVSVIQGVDYGTGTYNQVYNLENKYYGLLNRKQWPTPVQDILASKAGVLSGAVAAVGTATCVAGTDLVTVTGSTASLRAGEILVMNGIAFEIKYIVDGTNFIVTAPDTAGFAGVGVFVRYFYSIINISVNDLTIQDGAGVSQISGKTVIIAVPATTAGDVAPEVTLSADGTALLDVLNPWMTSTPLSPASITLI